MNICKVCGNSVGNKFFFAKEMMFGIRDEFQYMECSYCRSLQINEVPKQLSKYYPAHYHSFDQKENTENKNIANKTPHKQENQDNVASYNKWIKKLYPMKDWAVLDIGSGSGELLLEMKKMGFNNLSGCDPYLKEDVIYPHGPTIYKKDVYGIEGQYKLIMMHHSLEHMDEPNKILNKICSLLEPDGILLVRMPVANSLAFKLYKNYWVQLDAPRHLCIPSKKGMKILCERNNMELYRTNYDSTTFQFLGSKQYQMNIPLRDKRTYVNNPHQRLFRKYQIWWFKIMTIIANMIGDGDSAIYFIRKNKN